MGRWGSKLLANAGSQKNSSSVNHCSKSIFNNVIVTLTIYSFGSLSDNFLKKNFGWWWRFCNVVSCNVGAGQLSDRVPPHVYHITLQAAIRIAIRSKRRLYGQKVVSPIVIFYNCCGFNSYYSTSIFHCFFIRCRYGEYLGVLHLWSTVLSFC